MACCQLIYLVPARVFATALQSLALASRQLVLSTPSHNLGLTLRDHYSTVKYEDSKNHTKSTEENDQLVVP